MSGPPQNARDLFRGAKTRLPETLLAHDPAAAEQIRRSDKDAGSIDDTGARPGGRLLRLRGYFSLGYPKSTIAKIDKEVLAPKAADRSGEPQLLRELSARTGGRVLSG